ncbi:extracellular solute-binding protein [Candidatus Methylocalor cossyra]|uniref:Multiple sugar transport system substrate-binding protein n=1 Tax=Candidatus Methylocalor cossyra TaxID=3108543 RepID=A0ABM9NLK6_9GAMM
MEASIAMFFRPLFAWIVAVLVSACSGTPEPTTVQFWAMGREGEAVAALLPEFERRHPGLRVQVQQIPWSAAHEKLLTAYAGGTLPDLFQVGNTWLPEFWALRAIDSLEARFSPVGVLPREDFFPGILATNEIDGQLYGLPWYVDTRLLFYRKDLLARAGFAEPPRSWREWCAAMAAIRALPNGEHYPLLLPMNEWQVPMILGLQLGAAPLRDGDRYGNFRSPAFGKAFAFYLELFRQGFAPAVAEAQIANLYQEFARGYVAMVITGPWNLGEFERRLPADLKAQWATAPLPGPDAEYPGLSLAAGASLALARDSRHKAEAWKLMEFLAEPRWQVELYRRTGDLPARRSAWRSPELVAEPRVRAFAAQLERVVPVPRIPEWERIAAKLAQYAEKAVRGELDAAAALAGLDAEVDRILEKRRWLLGRAAP